MQLTHPLSTHDFVKFQEENKDLYDNFFKKYEDVLDHVKFLETPAHINQFIGEDPLFEGWYVWFEYNERTIIRNDNILEDLYWMIEKKYFQKSNSDKKLTKLKHLCSLTNY